MLFQFLFETRSNSNGDVHFLKFCDRLLVVKNKFASNFQQKNILENLIWRKLALIYESKNLVTPCNPQNMTDIYDFKLKGGDVLRGRYLELLPPPCDLTLKWSNFSPIGQISGLAKYIMFQDQVCLFSRNCFDFVCFARLWPTNSNFWLFLI